MHQLQREMQRIAELYAAMHTRLASHRADRSLEEWDTDVRLLQQLARRMDTHRQEREQALQQLDAAVRNLQKHSDTTTAAR